MELFLNILWLAIATAGVYVWRTRWALQPSDRRYAVWAQWAAFVCALILLFFMVSLTDDLHSDLVVFEECSAGRRNTTYLICPHHSPQNHSPVNIRALVAAPVLLVVPVAFASIAEKRESSPVNFETSPPSGRAPPVIFL